MDWIMITLNSKWLFRKYSGPGHNGEVLERIQFRRFLPVESRMDLEDD
jgi:hypothetical protein